MQSRGARIGVVVVSIAVVVILFLVLRDGDSDDGEPTTSVATTTESSEDGAAAPVNPNKEPKPEPPEPEVVKESIEVEAGAPAGGVQELEVPSGEKAQITVTSPDTTEHVHLHGYDIFADLAPGQPAVIKFEATIDGVFEMELEDSVTPIAEITVK